MIENKVLVTINVPSLEKSYDAYIPVNRKIYSVIEMLKTILYSLSQGSFEMKDDYLIYNAIDGMEYDPNVLVRDTNIRNGSTIILL